MQVGNPLENRPICSNKHSWEDNNKTQFKGIIMNECTRTGSGQHSIRSSYDESKECRFTYFLVSRRVAVLRTKPLPLYSGPRVPRRILGFLILNMKAVRCFESSVNIYHATRHNIAEGSHDQHCCENLILCKISDFRTPQLQRNQYSTLTMPPHELHNEPQTHST